MPFFRRDKPLHERLADEAELDIGQTGPPRPQSPFAGFLHSLANNDAVGIHGVHRQREWDAVATTNAELPGVEIDFVALPDGTLLVDADLPEGALAPLADALEASVAPPYRARGVRQDGDVWAVAARRIEVRAFPEADEDDVELVEGATVVIGTRLDGDLFEVETTPL